MQVPDSGRDLASKEQMESNGGPWCLLLASGAQRHRHTHTNIHTQINRLKMLIYKKLINLPLVKLIMKNLKRSKGLNKRIIFQILFRKNGSKMKAHDLLNPLLTHGTKDTDCGVSARLQSLVSLKSFGLSPGWPGTL